MALLTNDLLECLEHVRIHLNKLTAELERMKRHLEQEAERERAEKDKTNGK